MTDRAAGERNPPRRVFDPKGLENGVQMCYNILLVFS